MAELKTKLTTQSVDQFLGKIADKQVQEDCQALVKLMQKASGYPARMWGTAIVGFGQYHYKYDSGREGDMCLVGFSPRKQNITLYVMAGAPGQDTLLKKLGKHKTGKGCLYLKKLEDVDPGVLEGIIKQAIEHLKKKYAE
jgi:hypothetical protein